MLQEMCKKLPVSALLWTSLSPSLAQARDCEAWYAELEPVSELSSLLDEPSGLARGAEEGVLWTHEDAGGVDALFSISGESGAITGETQLSGWENQDWEDLASGACSDGCACLFLADTGADQTGGSAARILIVEEPLPGTPQVAAAALELSWPADLEEAEALLYHPDEGLLLISREDDGARLYQVEGELRSEGGEAELVLAGEIPDLFDVTAAEVSPWGTGAVLVASERLYLFDLSQGVLSGLLEGGTELPVGNFEDLEAITWSHDGTLFLLAEDEEQALTRVECAEESPPPDRLPDLCLEAVQSCGCRSGLGRMNSLALLLLALGSGLLRRRD